MDDTKQIATPNDTSPEPNEGHAVRREVYVRGSGSAIPSASTVEQEIADSD